MPRQPVCLGIARLLVWCPSITERRQPSSCPWPRGAARVEEPMWEGELSAVKGRCWVCGETWSKAQGCVWP